MSDGKVDLSEHIREASVQGHSHDLVIKGQRPQLLDFLRADVLNDVIREGKFMKEASASSRP